MKTLAEITEKLRQIRPDLQRRYPIRDLGIFGSYARGEQTEDSDLDIIVDLHDAIGLMELE